MIGTHIIPVMLLVITSNVKLLSLPVMSRVALLSVFVDQ